MTEPASSPLKTPILVSVIQLCRPIATMLPEGVRNLYAIGIIKKDEYDCASLHALLHSC